MVEKEQNGAQLGIKVIKPGTPDANLNALSTELPHLFRYANLNALSTELPHLFRYLFLLSSILILISAAQLVRR